MATRTFFDCLDVAEQCQAQAVEVELADDQSTEADPEAEVLAFVNRPALPDLPAIEATRPAAARSSRGNADSGSSTRSTPFAEAAGLLSTGQ